MTVVAAEDVLEPIQGKVHSIFSNPDANLDGFSELEIAVVAAPSSDDGQAVSASGTVPLRQPPYRPEADAMVVDAIGTSGNHPAQHLSFGDPKISEAMTQNSASAPVEGQMWLESHHALQAPGAEHLLDPAVINDFSRWSTPHVLKVSAPENRVSASRRIEQEIDSPDLIVMLSDGTMLPFTSTVGLTELIHQTNKAAQVPRESSAMETTEVTELIVPIPDTEITANREIGIQQHSIARQNRATHWRCCQCNLFHVWALYARCVECDHRRDGYFLRCCEPLYLAANRDDAPLPDWRPPKSSAQHVRGTGDAFFHHASDSNKRILDCLRTDSEQFNRLLEIHLFWFSAKRRVLCRRMGTVWMHQRTLKSFSQGVDLGEEATKLEYLHQDFFSEELVICQIETLISLQLLLKEPATIGAWRSLIERRGQFTIPEILDKLVGMHWQGRNMASGTFIDRLACISNIHQRYDLTAV
jgi:hypothetical protein